MTATRKLCFVLALTFAAGARAGYLPDPAAAEAALWASPMVVQARAESAAQALRSQSLQHGRSEWTVGADVGGRRIETTPRDDVAEWGLALSRPLRLPGRAEADRALGGALAAHAEASLGEALHESGRQLLAHWFAWLAEAGQAPVWDAHVALAEEQLTAVDARIRLGEAPRSDRVNADAALAQARLQQQQAATRAQQARSRLLAQYPGLVPTTDEALPEPAAPAGNAEAHAEEVLAHSHELLRARRHAEVLQAEARQFASRRSADPSVGMFYKNEMGGDEHVLGVSVGLTLPGAARRTDQQAAEALAAAAQEAADRLEQRLRHEARADFETATAQVAAWQQADRAAQSLAEAARLAARAYGLGEGSLDQVLLSRRLAQEGALAAHQAQSEALAANARLLLDAHQLWPLDVDTDGEHAHP